MKRAFSLFIVLMCCVCVKGNSVAEELSFQSFLSDISSALEIRSSLTPNQNEDEMVYWEKLVSYESDVFEKYKNVDFGTKKLNQLISAYENGVHLQKISVYFFERNQRVYEALWTAGLKARSAVIVELYEDYDLRASKEMMTTFYNNLNPVVSYTLSALPSATIASTAVPTATPTVAPTSTPHVALSSSEKALLADAANRLQLACDTILLISGIDSITDISVSYLQNKSAFVCYVETSASASEYNRKAEQSISLQNTTQKLLEVLYETIHTEVCEITSKAVDVSVALVDVRNTVIVKFENGNWS